MKKKQIKDLKISELKVGDILLYKSGEKFRGFGYNSKYAKVTQIGSDKIVISYYWLCDFKYAKDSFYVLVNPTLIKFVESKIATMRRSRTRRPSPISI